MSLFSKEMAEQIATTIRDNYSTFFPSNKEAKFAQKSNATWEELTFSLNANFASALTVKQVKEKWHNMKKDSKRRFADEKREKRKTGGGRDESQPQDSVHSAIVDTFGERASFSGIPGARSTPLFADFSAEDDLEIQALTGLEKEKPFKLMKTEFGQSPSPGPSRMRRSATSSVTDLQREVLQLQKELFENRISPLVDKMSAYYDAKIAKLLKEQEDAKEED